MYLYVNKVTSKEPNNDFNPLGMASKVSCQTGIQHLIFGGISELLYELQLNFQVLFQ